jgi:hypothetical protein
MAEHPPFNIQEVIRYFNNSLHENDDVKLVEYIRAYAELSRYQKLFIKKSYLLSRLLKDLGILFSFVESDVHTKREILERLTTEDPDNYFTVKSMVFHECGDKDSAPKERGSRTLLRLHRALAFITVFVEGIHKSSEDSSTKEIFRESYEKTLSHHHSWLIRKSVSFASHTIPNRTELIEIIFKNVEDHDQLDAVATEFLNEMKNVYARVQLIFETHNLLNLP